MRLLLLPVIGIGNVAGDSDFHAYSAVMRKFSELHKCFFYLALPAKQIQAAHEELDDLTNVLLIPNHHDLADYHRDAVTFDLPEWKRTFSVPFGRYPVDAVIGSRIPIHVPIAVTIGDTRRRATLPVFCHDPVPWPERLGSVVSLAERLARAVGYVYSWTWLMHKHDDEVVTEFLKKYVSAAMVKEYKRKLKIAGRGLDFVSLNLYLKDTRKFKKFSVLFGARMNATKGAGEAFEFLENLVKFGRDIDVFLTQPKTGVNESVIADFERRKTFIRFYQENCAKSTYLTILSHCHCAVCASTFEGEPRGVLEQLYLLDGLVIVPDRPWARAVFPREFPWFYKNKIDGQRILRYFYYHRNEALEKSSWIRQWLIENKDGSGIIEDEWNRIAAAVKEYRELSVPIPKKVSDSIYGSFRGQMMSLAEDYKKRGEPIDFLKFRNQLMRMSAAINFGVDGSNRAPAVYAVYCDLLSRGGWQDTYETADPILVHPDWGK
jgi:hypothetical protein